MRCFFSCVVFFYATKKKTFCVFATHPVYVRGCHCARRARASRGWWPCRRAPYTVCPLIIIGHHRVAAESESEMCFSVYRYLQARHLLIVRNTNADTGWIGRFLIWEKGARSTLASVQSLPNFLFSCAHVGRGKMREHQNPNFLVLVFLVFIDRCPFPVLNRGMRNGVCAPAVWRVSRMCFSRVYTLGVPGYETWSFWSHSGMYLVPPLFFYTRVCTRVPRRVFVGHARVRTRVPPIEYVIPY